MKIAISNIAWERNDQQKILTLLQKYHINGIEIAPTKITPDPTTIKSSTIKEYKREIKSYGIDIIAVQSLLFNKPHLNIFGTRETRRQTLDYLQKIISLGNAFGAKIFVFGSPKNRIIGSNDKRKAFRIAIDFFFQIAEFCQKYKSFFCIEPNSRAYDCDFIVTGRQALELVKAVNHPHFRINLDTGVMHLNKENPAATIELCFEYLAHMHLSAPYLKSLENTTIPHIKIAKTLKNLKYNKYVSIEMLPNKKLALMEIERSLKIICNHYL